MDGQMVCHPLGAGSAPGTTISFVGVAGEAALLNYRVPRWPSRPCFAQMNTPSSSSLFAYGGKYQGNYMLAILTGSWYGQATPPYHSIRTGLLGLRFRDILQRGKGRNSPGARPLAESLAGLILAVRVSRGVGGDIGAILDQPYCSESARTLVVCSGEKAGDIRANRGET
ncbi:hypothetical protein CCM_04532 [Cordyceps militaris CM01]|uniref:Uncharacterized protein n=1 Tax=Cordyceps militaris (strain CM01) TaxID=983644 RepID=G3JFH0_CORMM|nr:uncharacterized protein CCM_04532 [Cordyceps militaris CM01]EGX93160.1 hypothetical protein CCM_04532 [Cordyceps militaris CM01]